MPKRMRSVLPDTLKGQALAPEVREWFEGQARDLSHTVRGLRRRLGKGSTPDPQIEEALRTYAAHAIAERGLSGQFLHLLALAAERAKQGQDTTPLVNALTRLHASMKGASFLKLLTLKSLDPRAPDADPGPPEQTLEAYLLRTEAKSRATLARRKHGPDPA